jgi:hypothetical protein
MNSIELREEKRRAGTEVECGSSLQIALCVQTSEDALQFATDVLGIAKGAGTFGKAHFAISAGPIMDVLEEVVVHCADLSRRQNGSSERAKVIAVSYSSSASGEVSRALFLSIVRPAPRQCSRLLRCGQSTLPSAVPLATASNASYT